VRAARRTLEPAGPWWWAVLAAGAALRVFLAVATGGTDDVRIWQSHAGWTWEYGLVGYYERSPVFNHPPFAAWLMQGVWMLARATGWPFGALERALFAALDLGNTLLLLSLLRGERHRALVAACYWLHPLAFVFSAYHGNTDTAVAFSMLLAVWAAVRGSAVGAGAALGAGLWIKVPVLLAAPAIAFALPDARQRLRFAAALGAVGLSTYLPALLAAPDLVVSRVFGYAGRRISTPGGTAIWGVWGVLGAPDALPEWLAPLSRAHLAANAAVCGLPVLLLAWLRQGERSPRGLGTTVCASLCIVFGFTHSPWAFQYAAWIAPFLFLPGWRFALLATLALGGYVYAVYAWLTGHPLLLGDWDFGATPEWPALLVAWRDAAVAFCFASAWGFLGAAAWRRWIRA